MLQNWEIQEYLLFMEMLYGFKGETTVGFSLCVEE